MTEQELKSVGFEKVTISKEESGSKPYHYYEYSIGNIGFMTQPSDQVKGKDGWFVCFFDYDEIEIYNYNDLKALLDVLNNNKID